MYLFHLPFPATMQHSRGAFGRTVIGWRGLNCIPQPIVPPGEDEAREPHPDLTATGLQG